MKRSSLFRVFLLAGSTALCVGGPGAFAAEVAPPVGAATSVGEVIVTAQKRSENVQRVPIAISVLGAQAIKDRGIRSITDVQNEIPGFKYGEFSGTANVSIRGVGTEFVSGAGQSSVAIYVDDVYLSRLDSFGMGQYDLADIEVLKGPQGTLYGRNSTGGVANFTSTAPTSVPSAGATIGIGNYADKKAAGYISGPLGTDKVRARLYLDSEQRDGYVVNDFTGQRVGDLRAFGGRLSVDADLTPWWTATARLSERREDCACTYEDGFDPKLSPLSLPAPYIDFDPYRINSPVKYAGARIDYLYALKNSFKISDSVDLVSTTGYHDFSSRAFFDALGNTLIPLPLRESSNDKTFTQELDLKGRTKRLQWIAGFYYFNDTMNLTSHTDESNLLIPGDYHTNIGDPATSVIESGIQHSKEESEALFGDVTYEVRSGTRVFGGARVTYDKVDQALTVALNNQGTVTTACSATADPQSVSSTAVTGRVGAQQDVGDQSMGYIQYSRGFKSPNFSQSNCFNPYKAETIDAFEVGYKSRWLDGRLTLNAAAFYYNYENIQLEQVTLIGIPVVNAPKAHVYGAEFTATYRALDVLRFDANLELLSAAYDKFWNGDINFGTPYCGLGSNVQTGAGCPPGANLKGVQLDNSPNAAANLGVEYDQHLNAFGMLTFRAEASLTTSYHLREFNVPAAIQPGYALFNFNVIYHVPGDHWQLRAFVKNATNVDRLGGVEAYSGAIGNYQPPRTFGLEASVRY
jgi:iron complex outermembrane receptor protein